MPGHLADGSRGQGLPPLVGDDVQPDRGMVIRAERPRSSWRVVMLCIAIWPSCTWPKAPPDAAPVVESPAVQRMRQVLARVPGILAKNHRTFPAQGGTVDGFGAGDTYPQIWLRDSAWIVPAAAAFYDAPTLISWLDLHLSVATKSGRLRDWVAAGPPDAFREWAPHVTTIGSLAVDTNTNESDQEPSAALAYCRIEEALRGQATVTGPRHRTRVAKLVAAMQALIRDRTDEETGLIWSGLTADWGDVSPVHPDQRAIYFDAATPRTLSLYSNVMVYVALDCLSRLERAGRTHDALVGQATRLRDRIRAEFWSADSGFFRMRKTLDQAPPGFEDDDRRFALGGNALAALFGVASDDQAAALFETGERLRSADRSSTISTTLVPPYAAGVFPHAAMRMPFEYQNGGQWDWFGAAMVLAEFERGYSERARLHLDQIASRILKAGPGMHEWYGRDGAPRGSPAYAASAAAVFGAVARGMLGISRTTSGYQVTLRTGETLLPLEVGQRAGSGPIVVSQTVGATTVDVVVTSTLRVDEVCSVIPPGRLATSLAAVDAPFPRGIRQIGRDTLVCADTSTSPLPVRVRFGLSR